MRGVSVRCVMSVRAVSVRCQCDEGERCEVTEETAENGGGEGEKRRDRKAPYRDAGGRGETTP